MAVAAGKKAKNLGERFKKRRENESITLPMFGVRNDACDRGGEAPRPGLNRKNVSEGAVNVPV